MEKNNTSKFIEGIEFTPVKTIHDVLSKILV